MITDVDKGVAPKKQGMGIDNQVVQPVLEHPDREESTFFLETEDASNLGFYESHGFQTIEAGSVLGLDLKTRSMCREAKT